MNIAGIEDVIITTLEGLNLFQYVGSIGRKGKPLTLVYPCAFVNFSGDENTRSKPRPVYTLSYEIVIMCKNIALNSEEEIASDAYTLLDAVEQAINGKRLGITDIEPWTCMSRALTEYENAVMTYVIKIQTRHYLNVPTPD